MVEQLPKMQAFRYIGSKVQLAPWIIGHMPKHRIYIEPMCGSAAVLFSKPRSTYEVLNDIDGEICNFMLQVRDNYDKLQWKISRTPFSIDLYHQWRQEFKEGNLPTDPIERAARWVFTQEASFKGMWGKGWFSYLGARSYFNLIKRLEEMSKRLQGVALDVGQDYRVMVGKYDSPEVLFYFDPPYILENGNNSDYFAPYINRERFDHDALADLLVDRGLEGRWLLTYYDVPRIRELYDLPGIFSVTKEQTVGTSASKGKHPLKRTTLLLANFPLKEIEMK